MARSLLSILFCLGLVACVGSSRIGSTTTQSIATTDRIIPTRYNADRFFATAILSRGDTAVFFLDTGTGSYVWDISIPCLELMVKDTITNARGVKTGVASFPTFRADAALPTAIAESPQGTGLLVYAIDWRAQKIISARGSYEKVRLSLAPTGSTDACALVGKAPGRDARRVAAQTLRRDTRLPTRDGALLQARQLEHTALAEVTARTRDADPRAKLVERLRTELPVDEHTIAEEQRRRHLVSRLGERQSLW